MARWRVDRSAFRADPAAIRAPRPSGRQSIALLAVLVVVAGVVAAVSYLVRPDKARAFDLLHGSVLIADQFGPVSIDLASGKATLQLSGTDAQAGVRRPGGLALVPTDDGTLLLDRNSGQFNWVDSTGFVVKRNNSGVALRLGAQANTAAMGVADGANAFVQATGPSGTDVALVNDATVATAVDDPDHVRPRAVFHSSQPSYVGTAGTATSANGSLWTLLGAGGSVATGGAPARRTIHQLRVPARSSSGVTFTDAVRGTVSGAAALESATVDPSGVGPSVIGLADADGIRILGGAAPLTVSYPATAGLDRVVPVSNARGRLSFLLHGTAGWSAVSVATDGTDRRGPTALSGVPATADLAPPADSLDTLYTIDRASTDGDIYAVNLDLKVVPVEGATRYPQIGDGGRVEESASFDDAYLIARGPRVIVDSAAHYQALTIFTDAAHRAPLVVSKSNLTRVNATTGADTLTQGPVDANQKPADQPSGDKPKATAPSINNKIDCTSPTQKPHVPEIIGAEAASRSIGLKWQYRALDSQDCIPATYQVLVGRPAGAPSTPGQVTVQKSLDTVITGLYPNTQYRLTVVAYLGKQRTASAAVQVTTSKEGPAAARNLSVSPDSAGNWNLQWSSCGTVAQGCVPAETWTVSPSYCDNRDLSASPAPKTVAGDPSSVQQPPVVYRGGDPMLGRGLQFRVQGRGPDGTLGAVSGQSACVYSWARPDISALAFNASQPGVTSLGSATATTVAVNLGGGRATHNVGGVGATVTFNLAGPGGTQRHSVDYTGRSSLLASKFTGVQAGATYRASVTLAPPKHPSAAATTASKSVVTRADWPKLGVRAVCHTPAGFALTCPLLIRITGLSSQQARGERFDLLDSSQVRCGEAAFPIEAHRIDPGTWIYRKNVSLLDYQGTCRVTVGLYEDGQNPTPRVFGDTPSDTAETSVRLGNASTLNADSGDFSSTWDDTSAVVHVKYTGPNRDSDIDQVTTNWSLHIIDPAGTDCGSSNDRPTRAGVTVNLSPGSTCVDDSNNTGTWHLRISYTDKGSLLGGNHTVTDAIGNGPPKGYTPPCGLASDNFSAKWGGTAEAPIVTIVNDGRAGDVSGCSDVRYAVAEVSLLDNTDPQKGCGEPIDGSVRAASTDFAVNDACHADFGALVQPTYRVLVAWTGAREGFRKVAINIDGSPPK